MLKIYHNNRCGKSRETLKLVQENAEDVQIIEYLKTPPTEEELREIIKKLTIKPEQLLRKGEAIFKEKFEGKSLSDEEWIRIMVENPILIERPIVIKDGKAVLGRPPENVLQLFK
jgi:arsenate reductase (glutaredoxin)